MTGIDSTFSRLRAAPANASVCSTVGTTRSACAWGAVAHDEFGASEERREGTNTAAKAVRLPAEGRSTSEGGEMGVHNKAFRS